MQLQINNKPFTVNLRPFNHQITAYENAYEKEFFALFMEMATGKSKVSIDICCNLFLQGKIDAVLLIAPNGVQTQWFDEQVPQHSIVNTEHFLWKTNRSSSYLNQLRRFMINNHSRKLKWFYVNIETFSTKNHLEYFRQYLKNHNAIVIIDECTKIKNPEAQRTYNITYELNEYRLYHKIIQNFVYNSKYRLVLTGTMVTNSPFDLFSYFEFLKQGFWGINYFAFKATYGMLVRDSNFITNKAYFRQIRPDEIASIKKKSALGFTNLQLSMMFNTSEKNIEYIINNKDINITGYKNLDQLKKIIAPYSYICKKDDCLDLPKKMYEHIYVEMNPEQKRVYKELEKELIVNYSDKELSVSNKMVLLGRLQQITGGFFPYQDVYVDENGDEKVVRKEAKAMMITSSNPKINAILQDLEELADEQIIIWCRFTAEIKALTKILKEKLPEKVIEAYYGDISAEERRDIKNRFVAKKVDIFIGNTQTGALGLNLQVSHIVYYFSNDFSLERREQSEDRIHRPGQDKVCVYKDLIIKGTVDEKVYKILKEKKDLLNYFRDNSISDLINKE